MISLFIVWIVVAFCVGCAPPLIAEESFVAITFNVENIFDGEKNGREYERFRPPHWGKKDYEKKLVLVGNALQKLTSGSKGVKADLIALQEVENGGVVESLQKHYLPRFSHLAITEDAMTAVQVALLSRHRIVSTHTHDVSLAGLAGTLRPLLDVRVEIPHLPRNAKKQLQVLVVHLKSKRQSMGEYNSDLIRSFQYQLLAEVIEPDLPTIILGDFNDETPWKHLRHSRRGKKIFVAPVNIEGDDDISYEIEVKGTHFYKNHWAQLDHVIYDEVADALFENERSGIIARPPFVTSKGIPNRSSRTRSGVSDHLPVVFRADFCECLF